MAGKLCSLHSRAQRLGGSRAAVLLDLPAWPRAGWSAVGRRWAGVHTQLRAFVGTGGAAGSWQSSLCLPFCTSRTPIFVLGNRARGRGSPPPLQLGRSSKRQVKGGGVGGGGRAQTGSCGPVPGRVPGPEYGPDGCSSRSRPDPRGTPRVETPCGGWWHRKAGGPTVTGGSVSPGLLLGFLLHRPQHSSGLSR